ncbi:MAG: hypothetical protein U1D55_01430 [Phycisphaerae bacterium]
MPTISTRREFRLSVVSTPGPRSGRFYSLWNNDDRAGRGTASPSTTRRPAARARHRRGARCAVVDEAAWRSAYECEFVDEQYALLPYELLLARSDESLAYHTALPDLANLGDLYVGVDVGRLHDLTVLAFIELTQTEFVCRGFIELRGAPFDEQEQMLAAVMGLSNLRRCLLDATGMGLQLAERAQRRWGWRIQPVTISAPVKEDLCARMQRAFQRGEMRIPADRTLHSDLHSVERQITLAGNLRYAAGRVACFRGTPRKHALARTAQGMGGVLLPTAASMLTLSTARA